VRDEVLAVNALEDRCFHYSVEEVSELNARFERATPSEVIEWAVEQFHPYLCLTSSMTDAVLVDLAVRVEPSIEVVFIDTGYHFPETLGTLDLVRRRYGLNLRVMTVAPQPIELWRLDPERCCSAAKVAELERALLGKQAWMSGLRRSDAPSRASTPIVGYGRGLVKINPIATWSDPEVAAYIAAHDVPVNPLVQRGFPSIGCLPCTQQVASAADSRSGRWAGRDKTECGMHNSATTPGYSAAMASSMLTRAARRAGMVPAISPVAAPTTT
jgi:phosphoadenosine phosphosulfate reductase